MKPVNTDTTNCVLKGQTENVMDLPVTRYELPDGTPCVQSCWELSEDERKQIIATGKMYFNIFGTTHPPICLSCEPFVERGD